jgi:excisionase family DNA binding protein
MNRDMAMNLQSRAAMIPDKLLRKKQVAELLACSMRTVDRLVAVGGLTRVQILGGIRFRSSQVQQLINGGQHDF